MPAILRSAEQWPAVGHGARVEKGLIDRFRSLPTWGPAVLTGRILADVGSNAIQLVVMLVVGFAVGFRFSNGAAFVPPETMPDWLEPFADANQFTTMVDALFLGTPAGNDVWGAVVWSLAIVAVFAPLSAWRYRRSVTR